MYLTIPYTIPGFICDRNDQLTMWGMARLFQEAADAHVQNNKIGFKELKKNGKAWVLCRVFYHVDRLPQAGERVTLKTWSRGTDGLFAVREYQMLDTDGNAIVSGTSYWAIIDLETRHVIRINSLMEQFEAHPDIATTREKLFKMRLPGNGDSLQTVFSMPVKNSMLDHTQHVNNAEYIKLIFDEYPDNSNGRNLDFEIHYILETKPDDSVSVSRMQAESSTYFQISNSRGVSVLAKIN